jgi:hypothetical protein
LIGVSVTLTAPALLTVAGAVLRPIAKGFLKGDLCIADAMQEVIAEGTEQLSELVAAVRGNYAAAATVTEGYQQKITQERRHARMNTVGQVLPSLPKDPVERIVQYLSQYPYDLIDSRQLMRRLQVSAEEFQQALTRLERQGVLWAGYAGTGAGS